MKVFKPVNPMIFIALMGTSALALASGLIFDNPVMTTFSVVLELSVIGIFAWFFGAFLLQIVTQRARLVEELKHPIRANMYPGIAIASSLIVLMLLKIGIPYLGAYNRVLAVAFWVISIIFSVVFVVMIPINLKFRAKLNHVVGTWFIPPVGLFVLVSAGAVLGAQVSSLAYALSFLNLVLLGPAFVLYFLTLAMLYFRTVFHEMPQHSMTPTFNIVLAPVGVSIMAMLLTSKLLLSHDFFGIAGLFSGIARIYSVVMLGYGLWVLLGLLALYWRIIGERGILPFSEVWWAFIFPLGAFVLACSNLYSAFDVPFIRILYYGLYLVLLLLWTFVLYSHVRTLIKGHQGQPKGTTEATAS